MVHEKLITFFSGFKSDAHPMAIMVGVVGSLSAFFPDSTNIHCRSQRRLSAIRRGREHRMPGSEHAHARVEEGSARCWQRRGSGPDVFMLAYAEMVFRPCKLHTVLAKLRDQVDGFDGQIGAQLPFYACAHI
eukprot:1451056-Pleurochrysis_carterae.AAC.1